MEFEEQLLKLLQEMSAEQRMLAENVSKLTVTQNALLAELRKSPKSNIIDELKTALEPLAQNLENLSQQLAEVLPKLPTRSGT